MNETTKLNERHIQIGEGLKKEGIEKYYPKLFLPANEARGRYNKIALNLEPEFAMAEKGDIIFAHPFLCHKGGENYSANIRYQLYFRVHHKDFMQKAVKI